jgi:hypothetical protein
MAPYMITVDALEATLDPRAVIISCTDNGFCGPFHRLIPTDVPCNMPPNEGQHLLAAQHIVESWPLD